MKKTAGIWIDKRTAKIVTLRDNSEEFHIIKSTIEEYRPRGGSGRRQKGGPQDVVQDSKYTKREKQQQKVFFGNIIDYIKSSDDLVIFGPAQMGEKLYAEISEFYPGTHKKVKEVMPADSMTDNQIKAWVRDYFRSEK